MGPFHDMRVCGSYCGASWCGDSHVSEGPGCNFTATPDSCTDACCMEHDRCCGGLGREQCNHLMIQPGRRVAELGGTCEILGEETAEDAHAHHKAHRPLRRCLQACEANPSAAQCRSGCES